MYIDDKKIKNTDHSLHPIFSILALMYTVTGLWSCQINSPRQELNVVQSPSEPRKLPEPGKVDPKYSISSDRKKFEELRSEVDETQKVTNDERALFSEWMADVSMEPYRVRDSFDTLVRRKREEFNKDITRLRERYGKEEKKSREAYSKNLEEKRSDLKGAALDREARQSAFNELETQRRDYYLNEREKRDEFEAEVRTSRKDFDDYIKRRTDEFNAEYKSYLIKWKEKKSQ
jgi:hypothetical protein